MKGYIKTYKTRDNEAIINLSIGSVNVTCHFKNGNIRNGEWATLTTRDAVVQKAIEQSELFGSRILPSGEPIPFDTKEEKEYDLEKITNVSELRDYLVDRHGIERTKILSPNSMKVKVRELGIELPNMDW